MKDRSFLLQQINGTSSSINEPDTTTHTTQQPNSLLLRSSKSAIQKGYREGFQIKFQNKVSVGATIVDKKFTSYEDVSNVNAAEQDWRPAVSKIFCRLLLMYQSAFVTQRILLIV